MTKRSNLKYEPLKVYLENLPAKVNQLMVSFEEIEQIIRDKLPASAHNHRAWWANELIGRHVQSKQWLAAGWRVQDESVELVKGEVTFERTTYHG